MIETLVNITTACCYLVTAGVVVKYIYNRFIQREHPQNTNITIVKSQKITSLGNKASASVDSCCVSDCDDKEYKDRFMDNYTMKNRIQVYIDRNSYEYMKRFLCIAAPDTSMAGYVSRIINDHLVRNATAINKIFEDSKNKFF